eukprot:COSAG02_NODE_46493_length_348_cov_0.991968_1_plen_63_part_01
MFDATDGTRWGISGWTSGTNQEISERLCQAAIIESAYRSCALPYKRCFRRDQAHSSAIEACTV